MTALDAAIMASWPMVYVGGIENADLYKDRQALHLDLFEPPMLTRLLVVYEHVPHNLQA
jgi:hypothetical protein